METACLRGERAVAADAGSVSHVRPRRSNMSAIQQIEALFDTLERAEQRLILERLARRMRLGEIDKEVFAREMEEVANEPALNEPYPILEDHYSQEQLRPRGER